MTEPRVDCDNFVLVAAMNPCPCRYYGDTIKPCSCAPSTVTKYQKRISGPLLDRIDIHVEVPRVDYQKLSDDRLGEASSVIRARVEAARERQRARFDEKREPRIESREPRIANRNSTHESRFSALESSVVCNADMRVAEVRQYCKLDAAGESLVRAAMGQMNLSARGYQRVLKLARRSRTWQDASRYRLSTSPRCCSIGRGWWDRVGEVCAIDALGSRLPR
jgi:magnesium chelatase family protein